MKQRWYYTRQGEQVGPVPEEEVRTLLASGQIPSTEQVWQEGWEGRLSPQRALDLHFSKVGTRGDDEPPPFPLSLRRRTTPEPLSSRSPDEPPPFPPSSRKHDQSSKTMRPAVPSSKQHGGFDASGTRIVGSPSPQQDRPIAPGAFSQRKVSLGFQADKQDQGRILSLVRSIGKSIDLARNASVSQRLSGNVKCKVVRKTDGTYDMKTTTSEGDAVDAAAEIRTLFALVREHGGVLTDAAGREVRCVLKEARDYAAYANLAMITSFFLLGIGVVGFAVGKNIGSSIWFGALLMSPFAFLAQYVGNRLPFSGKCWKQIVNALEDAMGDQAYNMAYSAPRSSVGQRDWHHEEPSEQQLTRLASSGRRVRFCVIGGLVVVGIIVVWLLASTFLVYEDGYTHGESYAHLSKQGMELMHLDAAMRRDAEKQLEDVEGMVGALSALGANNANAAIPYPPGSFDRKVWAQGWRNGIRDGFK